MGEAGEFARFVGAVLDAPPQRHAPAPTTPATLTLTVNISR
jgi:hypothetical protein